MLTEEKAREKWCPNSRMVVVTNDDQHQVLNKTSFNRAIPKGEESEKSLLPRGCLCMASDCVMWEFENSDKVLGDCGFKTWLFM